MKNARIEPKMILNNDQALLRKSPDLNATNPMMSTAQNANAVSRPSSHGIVQRMAINATSYDSGRIGRRDSARHGRHTRRHRDGGELRGARSSRTARSDSRLAA